MIDLVRAEIRHIGRIAAGIRAIDREECEAMGRSPKQSLRLGLLTSDKAWTALLDGRPVAMFGVVTTDAIGGEATPWFLGTDEVYRHARAFIMWGPGMLSRMGDSRTRLSNLVSAHNSRAIRLLRRWGFEVGSDEVTIRGVPFLHFQKVIG